LSANVVVALRRLPEFGSFTIYSCLVSALPFSVHCRDCKCGRLGQTGEMLCHRNSDSPLFNPQRPLIAKARSEGGGTNSTGRNRRRGVSPSRRISEQQPHGASDRCNCAAPKTAPPPKSAASQNRFNSRLNARCSLSNNQGAGYMCQPDKPPPAHKSAGEAMYKQRDTFP
jgi:hypothetical protein